MKIEIEVKTGAGAVTTFKADGDDDAVLLAFLRWHGADVMSFVAKPAESSDDKIAAFPSPSALTVPLKPYVRRPRRDNAGALDEQMAVDILSTATIPVTKKDLTRSLVDKGVPMTSAHNAIKSLVDKKLVQQIYGVGPTRYQLHAPEWQNGAVGS